MVNACDGKLLGLVGHTQLRQAEPDGHHSRVIAQSKFSLVIAWNLVLLGIGLKDNLVRSADRSSLSWATV
jgi:hypothetical protein